MPILKKIHHLWKDWRKKYNETIQWKYYCILMLFFCGYGLVFTTGLLGGNNQRYEVLAVGQKENSGNFNYEVTKREYDPVTQTYRMDLWLSTETNLDLYTVDMTGSLILRSDPSVVYETNVTRVSANYVVLLTENVPETFDTLRQNVTYSIHSFSENELNQGETTQTLHLYATEKETEIVSFDASETSFSEDAAHYEIDLTYQEIDALKEKNEPNRSAIRTLRESLASQKEDAKYQVGKELESTNRRIDETQSRLNQTQARIVTNDSEIELLEEKISLLEQKVGF